MMKTASENGLKNTSWSICDMNIEEIRDKIQGIDRKPIDIHNFYAVLLPLIFIEKEPHILYELRADHLEVQPGEVCFPGGAIENGETPIEAAARETCEELNLQPDDIEIIGSLDYLVKTGSYVLYPHVGTLNTKPVDIEINKDEVRGIFTVPVSYLINYEPEEYKVSYKIHTEEDFPYDKINGGADYKWRSIGYSIPFYEFEGKVIWGMTARITKNFIERLKGSGV
jgi:8-oxo-dGTP pyrophosphatase MutT (NUDIX family)